MEFDGSTRHRQKQSEWAMFRIFALFFQMLGSVVALNSMERLLGGTRMALALDTWRGKIEIAENGTLVVARGDEVVLKLTRVFVEYYGVRFPTLRVVAMQRDDTSLRATLHTARPGLSITFQACAKADGFQLEWSAPPTIHGVGVNISKLPGEFWYGMGERIIQTFPLSTMPARSDPFDPMDHANDGTLNIVTPLWLNRAGAGVFVTDDTGELAIALKERDDEWLEILQRAPEPPPSTLYEPPPPAIARLPLRVLLGENIRAAHQLALTHLGRPKTAPPRELFERPIWTTWARFKMDITQTQTLQFADEIIAHEYPRSVMEIDDRWQSAYGDLDFDAQKFPDPGAMVKQLHARGFRVTLWVPPFIQRESKLFAPAAQKGFLLTHFDTGEPVLTRWWQGFGALVDVFNPDARAWWLAHLQRLQILYGIDGFKFDAGESNFIPRDVRRSEAMLRQRYADAYVAFVAQNFEWTEVRCGWRSQARGVFFREWDKWSRWGIDNGLHSLLTQALTLGLIGYPFVLPDMIGGNAYNGEAPDAELMIRWTQLTAALPSMQFSIAPWDFGKATDAICKRYAQLHETLAPVFQECIAETLRDGTPMVRPLFWHALDDARTYAIDDEFLLGEKLLVAPVVKPGQTARDIYLPQGTWRDYWNRTEYNGAQELKNYPAPLDTLPLFERVG
jgi:alpha-glucosidase (family GH31 glycosyl hydrolase)